MRASCTRINMLSKNTTAVAKKEIMRLIGELSAVELLELMKIDEPQTFKVGEEDLPVEVVKKLGL